MKLAKSSLIPVAIAAAIILLPQAILAQDADSLTDGTAAMERVIGAMNNPPALTDIESFDGTVEIIRLSDVQAGITAATIDDVDALQEENAAWLTEMHTALEANSMLSAAIGDADAEIDDVIALSLAEDGGWIVFIDDRDSESS